MKEIFLLVDGNSLMHRAFHALPLMDADGVYTNAIYGFFSMLLKVIREENVQYLAVCFDEHAPTFRHTVYAEYKAGRSATPFRGCAYSPGPGPRSGPPPACSPGSIPPAAP